MTNKNYIAMGTQEMLLIHSVYIIFFCIFPFFFIFKSGVDPFTEFSIEIYPCNYVRFTFVEIEEPIGKIKNSSSKERFIMDKKYVIYSKLGEDYSENRIADFLKGIAILMFCGSIIVGFVMAIQEISYDEKIFIWYVALIWWVSGLLSSTLILGFSEIINLLHKIRLQKYIVVLASQEEIVKKK